MLSNLAKLRNRALSFSSVDDHNNQDDLNALETVINEEDLQPANKGSPLKNHSSGILAKKKRRKFWLQDNNEKLQLLALQDDSVFETGSQDAICNTRYDVNEDVLIFEGAVCEDHKSTSRKSSNRYLNKKSCKDNESANVMIDVHRLVREQPIILPQVEIKKFDDVDKYLDAFRQRKREREHRRKQVLSSTIESHITNNALPLINESAEQNDSVERSYIEVRKNANPKNKLHYDKFCEKLRNQIKTANDNHLVSTQQRESWIQVKQNLKDEIAKKRNSRILKTNEPVIDLDRPFLNIGKQSQYSMDCLDQCSIAISDTRTEDAVQNAFEALKTLGTDEKDQSLCSLTEQWTINSLLTNRDASNEEPSTKIPVEHSNYSEEEFDCCLQSVKTLSGRSIQCEDEIVEEYQEPQINENHKDDYVRNWIEDQCMSNTEFSKISHVDLQYSLSEIDKNKGKVMCISSDEDESDEENQKEIVQSRDSEIAHSEKQSNVSYVNEEILNLPDIARDFIEDQAELSGSDVSADEDDNILSDENLDIIDMNCEDSNTNNYEINRIDIMRDIADDDRKLNDLRERYLHKIKPTRQKRFRWNDKDIDESESSFAFSEQEESTSSEQNDHEMNLSDEAKLGNSWERPRIQYENSIEGLLKNNKFNVIKGVVIENNGLEHQRSQFIRNMASNLAGPSKLNFVNNDYFLREDIDENANDGIDNVDSVFTHFSNP